MTRKETINKLVNEGFSLKTLANFSDGQLRTLAKTVLKEQSTDPNASPVNIPKDDTKSVEDAKNKKQKFVTYENEEITEDGWDSKSVSKTYKKVGKSPKKPKGSGDSGFFKDGEDGKYHGKDEFYKKLDGAKINPKTKELEAAESVNKKNIKNNKEKKQIKEWVKSLANENFHSFTKKHEIMELIDTKLTESEVAVQHGKNVKKGHNGIPEFMTYDAIMGNEPKPSQPGTSPEVAPAVKPGTKEPPLKNPRKLPTTTPNQNPRTKPVPKAISEDKKKK